MKRLLVLALALASAAVALLPARAEARTLYPGVCGTGVKHLQHRLAERSYLPDGYNTGCYDYRTEQAVMAFEGWVKYPRDGIYTDKDAERLKISKTPRPAATRKFRHIEIDKSRQVMVLINKKGEVKRTIHVSTGAAGTRTPSGKFRIYSKSTMSWSTIFHVWLPYASYVVGGIAIHGFASVPPYPASHGCIRVPMVEAKVAYKFARLDTPVWIRK
jgi:lipoprotein-anchoring transpeptidase ErfK/SrfK